MRGRELRKNDLAPFLMGNGDAIGGTDSGSKWTRSKWIYPARNSKSMDHRNPRKREYIGKPATRLLECR